MKRKFKRTNKDELVAGVCGGMSYWLGIPVWLVRSIWLFSILFYGIGMGLYVILWICVPRWEKDPKDYEEIAT